MSDAVVLTEKGHTLARFLFDADRWVDAETPAHVKQWICEWFKLPLDSTIETINESLKESKAFAAKKRGLS